MTNGAYKMTSFFRAQEPKAPVTYCDHALSGVRPSSVVCRLASVVCRPLDYLHFRLLLQNRLMDFDETWYGWVGGVALVHVYVLEHIVSLNYRIA